MQGFHGIKKEPRGAALKVKQGEKSDPVSEKRMAEPRSSGQQQL